MYCKYCGKEIPDDSKYCKNCGTKVEETNEVIDVVETTSKDDTTPNVGMVISTNEEAPKNIVIAFKPIITKETVANEVVANLKMIGLAICVVAAYFVGFSVYHAKDKKPLDDNGFFGESRFDRWLPDGSHDLSWEKIYCRWVYAAKPYSQWSSQNKKLGQLERDVNSIVPKDLTSYSPLRWQIDTGVDLKRANEIARSKGIPNDVLEKLQSEAKEKAKKERQSFNKEVSYNRKHAFIGALEDNMEMCAIISLAFFILGRYVIKFVKWVAKNKSE